MGSGLLRAHAEPWEAAAVGSQDRGRLGQQVFHDPAGFDAG